MAGPALCSICVGSVRLGAIGLAILGLSTCAVGAQQSSGYVTVEDAGQARAAIFVVEEFLDTEAPLEELSRRYAPFVSYYQRGQQSLEEVMRDKAAYMRRWPERRADPDLRTLSVSTSGIGRYEVSIEIDFEVSNGEARIAGRSLVEVGLRQRGDGFEVVREGGRVISRQD